MSDIKIRGSQQFSTVGLTDTIVLGANPKRRYVYVNNPSAGDIWLAWGQPAVQNVSFYPARGGAGIYFRYEDVGDLVTLELHAICATAAKSIALAIGEAP